MTASYKKSPKQSWSAGVITLFPNMFPGLLAESLAGKALEAGIWSLSVTDLRDFGVGKHRKVDDPPFGGGAGMVLRGDVMAAAVASAAAQLPSNVRRIYLSPRGKPLNQNLVADLAESTGVLLVCGRYEGLDERAITAANLEEISIGDYVLSGGEVAAQVLLDAVIRLLPEVIGNAESHRHDSFADGLLEHPHYTHPRDLAGDAVPEVLISGDHARIEAWRRAQAEALTRARRPDLLEMQKARDKSKN